MNKKNYPIVVSARPSYIPEQSDPNGRKFVWAYEISIYNESDEIIQLLNRRWLITDLSGRVEEVRGEGVTGLQPIIKPNKQFTYTSYCQLITPQGTMEGSYGMMNLEDEKFNIEIPKFVLSAPSSITKIYKSKLH